MAAQKSPRKLVIAIDFGTTFSGVAYWLGRDKPDSNQVRVICEWPASLPYDGEKPQVPTQLQYQDDGAVQWGNLISDKTTSIKWVKLLLLEQRDLPHYLRRNQSKHLRTAREQIDNLGKDAVTVVGDYLRELWRYAVIKIKEYEGSVLVDDCSFHVVLTVPAIWKSYARQRMQTAAERAGIMNPTARGGVSFSMTSEPEAAAHATLRSMGFGDRDADDGDTILVCDGGGGTVDVISYTLVNQETGQLKECIAGDGALCGAIFVDEEFSKYVQERFGTPLLNIAPAEDIDEAFSTHWENGIKRRFDGSKRLMPFRVGNQRIDLNETEIARCFRDVLGRIKDLLSNQIKGIIKTTSVAPKFIFLVGGFGRNQLLYNTLRDQFPESQVIKGAGDEPWSAVCRGAVLARAIEICASEQNPDAPANPVVSRKPRSSQGWTYAESLPEDHTAEESQDAEWDRIRGEWVLNNTMEWLVKRGQDVNTHLQIKEYTILLPMGTKGYHTVVAPIFESTSSNPPSQHREGDPDIRKTGREVTYDSPVPVEKLPIEKNELGENCRAFHIEWRIKVEGAALSAEAFSMGQKIADLAESEI